MSQNAREDGTHPKFLIIWMGWWWKKVSSTSNLAIFSFLRMGVMHTAYTFVKLYSLYYLHWPYVLVFCFKARPIPDAPPKRWKGPKSTLGQPCMEGARRVPSWAMQASSQKLWSMRLQFLRTTESPRLEKTPKIIRSNHHSTTNVTHQTAVPKCQVQMQAESVMGKWKAVKHFISLMTVKYWKNRDNF